MAAGQFFVWAKMACSRKDEKGLFIASIYQNYNGIIDLGSFSIDESTLGCPLPSEGKICKTNDKINCSMLHHFLLQIYVI